VFAAGAGWAAGAVFGSVTRVTPLISSEVEIKTGSSNRSEWDVTRRVTNPVNVCGHRTSARRNRPSHIDPLTMPHVGVRIVPLLQRRRLYRFSSRLTEHLDVRR
jgi:hypothetical protein